MAAGAFENNLRLAIIIKTFTLILAVLMLAAFSPPLAASAFDLKVTAFGGGQIQVLATNIPSGIRGYCVFETSSNLINWRPAITGFVAKTWCTNTFSTSNSVTFFRAWVY